MLADADEVTGADDEKLGYEALQGFETMATRSARGLWKLSRHVRTTPELERIFEGSNPEYIVSQLNASQDVDMERHGLAEPRRNATCSRPLLR